MSIEEMEAVWSEQKDRDSKCSANSENWINHARENTKRTEAVLWGCLFITVLGFTLKVHRLVTSPEVTLLNSSVDLLMGFGVIVCAYFSGQQYRRHRRELRSLAHDPVRCIEFLLQSTRREIRDTKCSLPIILLGILCLVLLSKWQSVSSGLESVANAGSGVALVVIVIGISAGVIYHRLNAFLEPRVSLLCHALAEFKSASTEVRGD